MTKPKLNPFKLAAKFLASKHETRNWLRFIHSYGDHLMASDALAMIVIPHKCDEGRYDKDGAKVEATIRSPNYSKTFALMLDNRGEPIDLTKPVDEAVDRKGKPKAYIYETQQGVKLAILKKYVDRLAKLGITEVETFGHVSNGFLVVGGVTASKGDFHISETDLAGKTGFAVLVMVCTLRN